MSAHATGRIGWWLPAVIIAMTAACNGDTNGPTIQIVDRDRHAHFTADGQSVVYYRQDERAGLPAGIHRVYLSSGTVSLLVEAILAGFDLHPQTDSIVFSARASGEDEPALWIIGLDGGGLRRLGGGGNDQGYRWPQFSPDGTLLAFERRFQDAPDLDTVPTLLIADWDGNIQSARPVGPGRRSAWLPDASALVVERRRPGGELPLVIAIMDTTGQLVDTLGAGSEPAMRPDGGMVSYLAEGAGDRGCIGVCFVTGPGATPVALSNTFESYPGGWSADGARYVFARFMETYEIEGPPAVLVATSRLWIRTLSSGADVQITF